MNKKIVGAHLSEDELFEMFEFDTNHFDNNASFGGKLFETFGIELEFVQHIKDKEPNRIWTILDVDGDMYIDSGYHHVNRLGYMISKESSPEGTEISVKLEG